MRVDSVYRRSTSVGFLEKTTQEFEVFTPCTAFDTRADVYRPRRRRDRFSDVLRIQPPAQENPEPTLLPRGDEGSGGPARFFRRTATGAAVGEGPFRFD